MGDDPDSLCGARANSSACERLVGIGGPSYIKSYILGHVSLAHVLLGLLSESASGYDLKRRFDEDGTRLY